MGSLALCTVTKDPSGGHAPCAGRPLIVPSAFTVNSTGPAPMYPAGAFVSIKRYLPGDLEGGRSVVLRLEGLLEVA